jgi:cell division protein FtsZ
MNMKFDLPQDNSSIIKVIGVGGGGSNAVNHMYKQGIKGVDFIVCNTDQQALDVSPVPLKIVLGASLTKGRGAGSLPEVGKNAALENIEEVKALLANNTEMVFITAGLGGGTGTGAAPVIAKVAKEMGILTVGIVTIPFGFEGKKRKAQADAGLDEFKQNVDTLLVISNDKLREIYGNLKVTEAFGHADDILATAAKGIADIITTTLQINTDINDVKTVMRDSGVAIMGSAQASGEQRALRAVEQAMSSPLLNDSNIKGARYVLVNVTCGEDEITMDELGEITDFIQDAAGMTAEVIKGYGVDFALGDKVSVTIIATGFNSNADLGIQVEKAPGKIIHILDDKPKVFDLHVTPVSNETPVKNEVSEVAEITASVKEDEIPVMENKMDVNQDSAEDFFTFLKEEKTTTNEETKQVTFEFEIAKGNTTIEEPYIISASTEDTIFDNTANTTTVNNTEENSFIAKVQNDEQRKKAQDRVLKLKELSFKLKSPNGLSELENEPAYKRRNINLESTPHSSETQISRYTLSEGEDKKVEIKPNNSFLHDNVD